MFKCDDPETILRSAEEATMRGHKCYEVEQLSPRVGCGCPNCYGTREMSLDPRLLALTRESPDWARSVISGPGRAVVHRALTHYLMGQMDYGALHITIIKALVHGWDREFEKILTMARLSPSAWASAKSVLSNLDNIPGDGA